ncbi:hypothetical protein ORV05_15035 [Amycolatopsis cynarae]|uniref:Uncharacterized protein n=1 Tax=Amycolatopsis cynarae TaxID=2995223 RepID=A0ABY7B9K6_9PSEU|nr:hypothetical protein [Amycolatopsis sp. HUAS 11-8]WAL69026.1 hypothetical protein ORV05_15035 [Amycolatopsis sp. HUAS 11-8]
MKYVWLVSGMILLAFGVQGVIRLVLDHRWTGVLGWLPGGFAGQLIGHLVLTVLGLVLAGRSRRLPEPTRARPGRGQDSGPRAK